MRFKIIISLAIFAMCAALTSHAQLTSIQQLDGDDPLDFFGRSIQSAGDVNGDGFDDIIVGAPFDDDAGSSSGRTRVYSGADGTLLYSIDGIQAGENSGIAVAGLGDLNGDGRSDFIIGAEKFSVPLSAEAGRARVHSGIDGSILYDYTGSDVLSRTGSSVCKMADINGDGVNEFIIGARTEDDPSPAATASFSGAVRVYSGQTGTLIHVVRGTFGLLDFGTSIADAGDVNGDGTHDFLVGTPDGVNSLSIVGNVKVFSGVDASLLHDINGQFVTNNSGLGSAADGVGDVNNDGFDDFIVGNPSANHNGLMSSGSAYVYSGQNGTVLHRIDGDAPLDFFGSSVAGVGDFNQDGFFDFAIGAPGHSGTAGLSTGIVRIYSGQSGSLIAEFEGASANESLGSSLAGLEDIDGNGSLDLLASGLTANNLAGLVRAIGFESAFEGSGEDFEISAGINAAPARFPQLKIGVPGDALSIRLNSPQGSYDFTVPVLAAQFFTPGSPPQSPGGFTELHINPVFPFNNTFVVLHDGTTTPGLGGVLLPQGLNFSYLIPPSFCGWNVMIQALVLAPSPNQNNAFFTTTDPQVVSIP